MNGEGLCKKVSQVQHPEDKIHEELSLGDPIADPVKTHIDAF